MSKIHCVVSVLALGFFCGVQSKAGKTELRAPKAHSVQAAMDIEKNICIPLKALEKANKNPLIAELHSIAEDLFKLAFKKVAGKYETFVKTSKLFEQSFEASENKVAYLETWIAMADKRVNKLADYKDRLDKIQGRLADVDKKIQALQGSDAALKKDLCHYVAQLKKNITMTNEWIAKSKQVFSIQLNELKSRETKFKKAGVPLA